jgi:hypothetical protein
MVEILYSVPLNRLIVAFVNGELVPPCTTCSISSVNKLLYLRNTYYLHDYKFSLGILVTKV